MADLDQQAAPAFLTVKELAALLRIKERKVYDLAATGAVPCSRVTGKLLFPRPAVEAWVSGASTGPAVAPARSPVFLGSHDPLLDWALRESLSGFATLLDGSLDGLERFLGGEGVATGLHLFDAESQAWNVPEVRARCGGRDVVLVAWAVRQRGLVVRAEDADRIGGIAHLAGCRVVPRQAESGAQTFLAQALDAAGLSPEAVTWTPPARSEADAVLAVAQGAADAAFGLKALAQPYGLAFVPVTGERFDLLVDRRTWFEPPMQRLMAFARTPAFRARAAALAGYDVRHLGEVRWNA